MLENFVPDKIVETRAITDILTQNHVNNVKPVYCIYIIYVFLGKYICDSPVTKFSSITLVIL
jgi:hypothetical protein